MSQCSIRLLLELIVQVSDEKLRESMWEMSASRWQTSKLQTLEHLVVHSSGAVDSQQALPD